VRLSALSVLLYPHCPTGHHPGSVHAYLVGYPVKHTVIPFPLQYACGCEDPRRARW
jgi:hypothetical protein